MSDSDYHGIIIREGFRDQGLLDEMKILGERTGKKWTLLKVRTSHEAIDRTIHLIQSNLLIEKDVPYYAHFYRANELIVVFPERIFHISPDKTSWSEVLVYGESLGIPRPELDFKPCRIEDETFQSLVTTTGEYSQRLTSFLVSNKIWHRFIEFDEPVKTVEQAARKVDVEQIAKSIILIDSNNQPLMAILRANDKISYKKLKGLLSVKDVRLANAEEVLQHSGYPVGGVPPFNNLRRTLLDRRVLKATSVIAGGGDVNKLVELRVKDIVDVIRPTIADLTAET